jgi:hypothetical protein
LQQIEEAVQNRPQAESKIGHSKSGEVPQTALFASAAPSVGTGHFPAGSGTFFSVV